jgi:hypothetical protein
VSSDPGDHGLITGAQPLKEVIVVYNKADKAFGCRHQDRVYNSLPDY